MKVKNFWLFFMLVLSGLIAVACNPQPANAEPAAGLGAQSLETSPPTVLAAEPRVSLGTQPVEASPTTGSAPEPVGGLGTQLVKVSTPASSGTAITKTQVFSLQSNVIDGHMVYVGVGGDIDGLVNPDLVVQPGVRVHVTLTNGDGIVHDIAFPNFGINSALVSSKGETSEVSFDVKEDQIGTYAYFCTRPGHRQAGQEGQLIVSGS